MTSNYLTSGQLIAKYPKLITNHITARDLGSFVRLEVDGYYNTTKRRIVILESEVHEILKFIKEGLTRKQRRITFTNEQGNKKDNTYYLTSEEILAHNPVLKKCKVVPSDLTMLAKLNALDAYFNSTIKKLVILESEVEHIIHFVRASVERKIQRRLGS